MYISNKLIDHIFIGKKKTSVCKLFIYKNANNHSFINGEKAEKYLKTFYKKTYIPIDLCKKNETKEEDLSQKENNHLLKDFSFKAKITGGGMSSQATALMFAISKYLASLDIKYKFILKKYKLLTRDTRIVERKKYGYTKARKAPQRNKR